MIQVIDLHFRYSSSESNVIEGLNLTIQDHEWLIISGDSGSGKSTLALALAGFLGGIIPGEMTGEILVNGKNIKNLTLNKISKNVYLVQQNPENQFCTLRVRDELAFGLENQRIQIEEIEKRVQFSLCAVQAEDLINCNLDELSGGQQQKIAIATALALEPEILILDEPTSNLDPDASKTLFDVLSMLRKQEKLTVVVIEHRTKWIETLCTRHLAMREGRLFPKDDKHHGKTKIARENKNYLPQKAKDALIELSDHKVFQGEKIVLNINSLEVNSGEIVSLMGPNGSGKTSLLLSIMGLVEAESESGVLINGRTSEGNIRKNLHHFGLVFQNPDYQIFCDTVKGEINYAPVNYGGNQLDHAWINHLAIEFGFDKKQNQHPYLLSYGQKGRLNLTSILSFKPKILLLDEIFIGQDIMHVYFLLEIIQDYARNHNAAAILVNHLYHPVMEFADRLIFLENGTKLIDCLARDAKSELLRFEKQAYYQEAYA